MTEENIVQKIERWKPMAKRLMGRPKTCWEDDVLEDIRKYLAPQEQMIATAGLQPIKK